MDFFTVTRAPCILSAAPSPTRGIEIVSCVSQKMQTALFLLRPLTCLGLVLHPVGFSFGLWMASGLLNSPSFPPSLLRSSCLVLGLLLSFAHWFAARGHCAHCSTFHLCGADALLPPGGWKLCSIRSSESCGVFLAPLVWRAQRSPLLCCKPRGCGREFNSNCYRGQTTDQTES